MSLLQPAALLGQTTGVSRRATVMLLGLAAASGWASALRADAPPVEIAVLPTRSAGAVSAEQAGSLTGLLASLVAGRPGYSVVTNDDIAGILGFEAQRQLLGCENDSVCLAEIGGALGVTYLLATEASRFGDTWLLSLSVIDLELGRSASRTTVQADDERTLLDRVPGAVDRVFGPLEGDAFRPEPPTRRDDRAGFDLHRRWWFWTAAGAVAVGAGAAAVMISGQGELPERSLTPIDYRAR
jgi:hypothetical protein